MNERRSESRKAVMVRVELAWEDAAGVSHTAQGKLEDKSPRGVAMRVTEEVPAGLRLRIKSPTGEFSGVVVRCQSVKRGFLLGVQRDTV